MLIRPASPDDSDAIWCILESVVLAGETFALPRDMSREAGLAYWFDPAHELYVAVDDGEVLGAYFLQPNQRGGGSHVANCGYMTAQHAVGRGIARAMCAHSLHRAQERGFRAMQFNFVVSTNVRAVRLWESFGFETLCRLPGAFLHPAKGYVDALVMFKALGDY